MAKEDRNFTFRHPRPDCAKRLAKQAQELAIREQYEEAAQLLERAIRCDQIMGLNEYIADRAKILDRVDQTNPSLAISFYNHAEQLKRQGRYRDVKVAYLESFRLDDSSSGLSTIMLGCLRPPRPHL